MGSHDCCCDPDVQDARLSLPVEGLRNLVCGAISDARSQVVDLRKPLGRQASIIA